MARLAYGGVSTRFLDGAASFLVEYRRFSSQSAHGWPTRWSIGAVCSRAWWSIDAVSVSVGRFGWSIDAFSPGRHGFGCRDEWSIDAVRTRVWKIA